MQDYLEQLQTLPMLSEDPSAALHAPEPAN